MAILHNQINKLWFNPSYTNFKKSLLVKQIFSASEAEDFIRTGAYLIKEAEKLSDTHEPWQHNRRLEILKNPRLENAFVSLGAEYLMKGIFIKNGYAVNKLKSPAPSGLNHPIQTKGNKSKLDPCEVVEFGYIVNHLPKIISFSDFDKTQSDEEVKAKKEAKGDRLDGITRMTIPYPNSKNMLDYLLFKRNYALHRPFIVPEFRGITRHVFNFLEYVAVQATGKKIEELAILTDE